jgi:hypothetical protein
LEEDFGLDFFGSPFFLDLFDKLVPLVDLLGIQFAKVRSLLDEFLFLDFKGNFFFVLFFH